MTSAPIDVADMPRRPTASAPSRWLVAGRVATVAAIMFCLLLQWINRDWFPPEISVSQYGIGPQGWIFTCWAALLVLAVLSLTRGGPQLGVRRARSTYWWLASGSAGLLVMGIVRTDAGGAQQSWHARTHMIGAIVALLALPVGILLAMSWTRRAWRRAALAVTAISAAALLLVLVSAFGVPTMGMDAAHSWAFWQAVAVTADMILVGLFALAGMAGPGGGRTRAAPR